MPVHQLAYRVVFGLDRRALRAAVVGQREQDGSARGTTPFGKIAEPALGHEIQQCRRGDEVAVRENLRTIERTQVEAFRIDGHHGGRSPRRLSEQFGIAIDEEPFVIGWKEARQVADVGAGAGRQIENAERPLPRQRVDDGARQRRGARREIGGLAQGEPVRQRLAQAQPPFVLPPDPTSANGRARAARPPRAAREARDLPSPAEARPRARPRRPAAREGRRRRR